MMEGMEDGMIPTDPGGEEAEVFATDEEEEEVDEEVEDEEVEEAVEKDLGCGPPRLRR